MRQVHTDPQHGPVYMDETGKLPGLYVHNGKQWFTYTLPAPPSGDLSFPPVPRAPAPPGPGSSSMMSSPQAADLAQQGVYRRSFYPTAPIYYRGAGKITRNYVATLNSTDADYAVNASIPRVIPFPHPVVLVSRNGSSFPAQAGNAFPVGMSPRGCFLVQFQVGQAAIEAIDTAPTLAENVLGTAERPGEIGGDGYPIDAGNPLLINITPLLASLNITITIVVLEQRGRQNYVTNPAISHATEQFVSIG